jgi:CRISPR-associated protein Csx16
MALPISITIFIVMIVEAAMTTYLVTRHAGAIEWARKRGHNGTLIKHFASDVVLPGDTVIGNLPLHIAAEVISKGARYLHLELRTPEDLRGRELSAADMERDDVAATLVEYKIERIG